MYYCVTTFKKKSMRIIFLLIPSILFSQFSKIDHKDLKNYNRNHLYQNEEKLKDVNLEYLINDGKEYMIDQNGGGVYICDNQILQKIDNSFQHKMQIKSSIYSKNDTIFRHGGYGFWNTRHQLTYFDFNNREWELIQSKNVGPKKYDHFQVLKGNKSIFFGGFKSQETIGVRHSKSLDIYEFDYLKRKWTDLGKTNYHFSKEDRFINIDKDKILIIRHDSLYLINPFEDSVEIFKSNPLLNNSISSKKMMSTYKDSIFYIINFIQSRKQFETKKLNYNSVLSNKIQKDYFLEKSHINYTLMVIFIFLISLIIFLTSEKIHKELVIVYLDKSVIRHNGENFNLSNQEYLILEYLLENKVSTTQDFLKIIDKDHLNYNHQLRILKKLIDELNIKFNLVLGVEILIKEKSMVDKRQTVYKINTNVIINK